MENADLHWHSSIEKLQNTDNCVRTTWNGIYTYQRSGVKIYLLSSLWTTKRQMKSYPEIMRLLSTFLNRFCPDFPHFRCFFSYRLPQLLFKNKYLYFVNIFNTYVYSMYAVTPIINVINVHIKILNINAYGR